MYRRRQRTEPGLGNPPTPTLLDALDDEDSALQSAQTLAAEFGEKVRENRSLKVELELAQERIRRAELERKLANLKVEPASSPASSGSISPEAERAVGRFVIRLLKRHGVSGAALAVAISAVATPIMEPKHDVNARVSALENELAELRAEMRKRAEAQQRYQVDTAAWIQLLARLQDIDARPDPSGPAIPEIPINQNRMPDTNSPKTTPLWRPDKYLPKP